MMPKTAGFSHFSAVMALKAIKGALDEARECDGQFQIDHLEDAVADLKKLTRQLNDVLWDLRGS
jgi:3-keto-L-gulonate-6-phosphate decarboxylase